MSAERVDYSWVPQATILLGEHGSRANGTHSPDSDHDYTGICAEPRRFVTGLQRFDVHRFNSAGNGKSSADDTDVSMFGLRKWAVLASNGSPNAMTPLFMSEYDVLTAAGQVLIDNRQVFMSRQVAARYLGFLDAQRSAVSGTNKNARPREHLVTRFGYDVKFAGAMIVAGLHGLALIREGQLALPLAANDVALVKNVRDGLLSLDQVMWLAESLEDQLRQAEIVSELPEYVDKSAVDDVLDRVYAVAWADVDSPSAAVHPALASAIG
jgi:hypothetical protein